MDIEPCRTTITPSNSLTRSPTRVIHATQPPTMPSPPTTPDPHRTATIGHPPNAWRHSSKTGFDLTRTTTTPAPSRPLTLHTTTTPLTLAPSTIALLIIDMQNFFLSPALGRAPTGPGHTACANLLAHAVPAARAAGVRVVWVNWGLDEQDIRDMPPGVRRAFGFVAVPDGADGNGNVTAGAAVEGGVGVDKHGREGAYSGIGSEMGRIELSGSEGGGQVDGGRLLMRGSWNADLYPPLRRVYEAGAKLPHRPDVWVHKNRMSGLWGAGTPLQRLLEEDGITTCLFAGVNTDQCVGGTLTDAFSKGFDCVLLGDGCGTSSPRYAQECWEYNAAHTFGFCCSCEDLARGVKEMLA